MLKGKITLYTYHKSTKNGYPIKIRLSDGRAKRTVYVTTGYYSFEKDWRDQEPLPSHPQYETLMIDVFEWRKSLFTLIPKANREKWNLSKLKIQFRQSESGFNVDKFIDNLELSKRTKEAYHTAINSFTKYNKHFNLDQIDDIEINRWIEDLKKDLTNNSINVYIRQLKALTNKAINLGHYNGKNFFIGKSLTSTETPNTGLSKEDIKKIIDLDFHKNSEAWHYKNYYLLMFYLGGLLPKDLAHLRYDQHFFNGRIEFERQKGGTSERVNNLVVPEALEILSQYDCKPYLVPIFKHKKYKNFMSNFVKRFPDHCKSAELSKRPIPKSARSTFMDIAEKLLIDERITMAIVGHKRKGTHGIYVSGFSDEVRDEAHKKIIS